MDSSDYFDLIRETGIEGTVFTGYSRMAVPISKFVVSEVTNPNVGENKPATVRVCLYPL